MQNFTGVDLWLAVRSLILLTIAVYSCYSLMQCYNQRKANHELGQLQECQLPPKLPTRWSFGIDRIAELLAANDDGRLLSFLCSIADEYEPHNILYQFLLIGPRAFHVMHPMDIKTVLSTNFKDYGLGCRPAVFAPLLGKGIFTQDGAAWKHSREVLRKHFARAHYRNLDHFQEHVDNLISRIGDGGTIDLRPLFFDLTLDVAIAVLFGRSVYSLRANIDQTARNRAFAESFDLAQEGLAKRFRFAPFHFLYNPASFRQACKYVHCFVEEYIAENQRQEGSSSDTTSSRFMEQIANEAVSVTELRDQMLNVLLAGRDTTACCLSWTFRLPVRHPSTLDYLREEIASIMGNCIEPTREHIRKMKFLSCVIKESLRLYPPVPLNNREAVRSTTLPTGGGPDGTSPILVRKGEMVVFSPYVTSRRKNIYEADANEFCPEQWETGELESIGWAYFPFNGGPRRCLGEDFALMEVSYTVVRLPQHFSKIVLPDGEASEAVGTEKQRLTLVLSSADGCKVDIAK